MKTRIVQNEPNDPTSGHASVTPTRPDRRRDRKLSGDSYKRVSNFRTSS